MTERGSRECLSCSLRWYLRSASRDTHSNFAVQLDEVTSSLKLKMAAVKFVQ
jgi:hypothetical protein